MNISRVLRIALMSAVVFLVPLHAHVQAGQWIMNTGNDLLESCAEPESSEYYLSCAMFLKGVVDMHIVTTSYSRHPFYCLPHEVTHGQLIRVVMKYLKEHPKDLHSFAAWLVAAALTDAYPCP
jgi:Rap1a immunity proteins